MCENLFKHTIQYNLDIYSYFQKNLFLQKYVNTVLEFLL